MSLMARRFISSVARGVSSGGSRPSRAESSRKAWIHGSVYSRSGLPAFAAPAMVLSSTSV